MRKFSNIPGFEGIVWHDSNVNVERLREIAKSRDEKAHEQWLKDYDDGFEQYVKNKHKIK